MSMLPIEKRTSVLYNCIIATQENAITKEKIMGEDYAERYREMIEELLEDVKEEEKLEYIYWFIKEKLKVGK